MDSEDEFADGHRGEAISDFKGQRVPGSFSWYCDGWLNQGYLLWFSMLLSCESVFNKSTPFNVNSFCVSLVRFSAMLNEEYNQPKLRVKG